MRRALVLVVVAVASGCALSTHPYGLPCDPSEGCTAPYLCVDVDGRGAQCVPPDLHVDDSDAGASDAGASDAGASDAGRSDAGRSDAGRPDAGAVDAGDVDAGAVDAGPVDAGPPDAGPPSDAGPGSGLWLRVVMETGPESDVDLHVMRDALSEYCRPGSSDCYVFPCQTSVLDTDWDGDGAGEGAADPAHSTTYPTTDGGPTIETVESLHAPAGSYYIVADRWPNDFDAVSVRVEIFESTTLLQTISRTLGIDSQSWVVAEVILPPDGGPWVVNEIDTCDVGASCVQDTLPDAGLAPEACEP